MMVSSPPADKTAWAFPFSQAEWDHTPCAVQDHVLTLQNQLHELQNQYQQLQQQVDILQGRVDNNLANLQEAAIVGFPLHKARKASTAQVIRQTWGAKRPCGLWAPVPDAD
jgi:hypothetical protein